MKLRSLSTALPNMARAFTTLLPLLLGRRGQGRGGHAVTAPFHASIALRLLIAGALCQLTPTLSQAQPAASAPAAAVAPGEAQQAPGPGEVIKQKIRAEVAARLTEAGAACDD